MRSIEHDLRTAILNSYPYKKVRCIKKGSVDGIEVGDECVVSSSKIVPIIRWWSEGEERPFNGITLEDSRDFEFVDIKA